MRWVLLVALVGAAIAAPTSSAIEPGDAAWSKNKRFRAQVLSVPNPIKVNQLHRWRVSLRSRAGRPVLGAKIGIAGDMPAHGHGLPTRPQARALGGGRYLIEGVKFQMPGEWYLELRISHRGVRDRVRFVFTLT
jgi:YtkA-like